MDLGWDGDPNILPTSMSQCRVYPRNDLFKCCLEEDRCNIFYEIVAHCSEIFEIRINERHNIDKSAEINNDM